MKTIFYLGDDIDVSNLIPIDIRLTSLGLDELTITNFNGKFLDSIEYNGSAITIDKDNPFIVNIDEVRLLKLNLKLEDIQSLPTHIYIETKELFEHTSILMFRGGSEPEDIILPARIFLDYNPIVLNIFNIETNKDQAPNIDVGSFDVSNSGSSNLIITEINFVDTVNEQNTIKDFISFRDSNGNNFVTLAPGEQTTFFIDIDTRTSGTNSPTNTFLEEYDINEKTNESILEVKGHIEITSNNEGIVGSKNIISISGNAYAPLMSFEVINKLREVSDISELIFNYKYNKDNTKDLENILKIHNNGNMDLIISDITTNYSISETNVIVYPITTNDVGISNVTITPGNSFDFNFIFDPIKRANKLDANGDPILNSFVDYKEEIERNLIIKSNALNFSEITDADYGIAFTNNRAINKRIFLSSIWYEESPYAWHPIERNEFIFSLLQPGGRNLQKLQIYNGIITNPEETFRVEIVYHGAEVGTDAFLTNQNYKNQLTSKASIFINVNKNSISGDSNTLGELQTYINVSLSMEANEDRYIEGEQETSLAQGGDPNLIGYIRKKYDFVKDKNPFKILITRVTDNQEDSNGNTVSFIDSKDKKEYWDILDGTGLPESLLLYLYGVARRIVYKSNSLATLSSSVINDFFDLIQVTPIVDSFSIVSLSPSLDQGADFKSGSYGIHKSIILSYSSAFLNIEGSLEVSVRNFSPTTYSYSIGNLSITTLIDFFDTKQKTTFSYSLLISSLMGSDVDTSIKGFVSTVYGNSLASLSPYVNINNMQDGTSVEVTTGFIQGYVPPDPTLQPPKISSALVSLAIKEFVSNYAWNGDPNIDEYWNFLKTKQFVPFIADEIKSHSIASLSLLDSTLDINTPFIWGVKRLSGNIFKSNSVASLAIGVDINNMIDGRSVESIQWTLPPPTEVYSYSLINFNISESILFKGSTKEWGINQATATTHPELAISIYSNSIASLSLRKDTTINKPSGAGNMFGVTRFDPSSDPPIISHAVVTIAVEDIQLGELHAP